MCGLLLASLACADDDDTKDGAVDEPVNSTTATLPDFYGVDEASPAHETYAPSPRRESSVDCLAKLPPPNGYKVTLVPAFEHLTTNADTFKAATSMIEVAPGRWFMTLLGGRVLAFSETEPGVETVLELTDRLDFSSRENGLVSVALHPDFASNGWMFAV